jgi:hypothetical protein
MFLVLKYPFLKKERKGMNLNKLQGWRNMKTTVEKYPDYVGMLILIGLIVSSTCYNRQVNKGGWPS